MPKYIDYFETETIGVQPSNWTERWLTANTSTTVEDDGGSPTDLLLRNVTTASQDWPLLTFDSVNADADRADCMVLARVKPDSSSQFGIVVRGNDNGGAEEGYIFRFQFAFTTKLNVLAPGRLPTNGITNIFREGSVNVTNNQWNWIRCAIVGNTLMSKAWVETDPEPDWQLWVQDSYFDGASGSNWIGITQEGISTTDVSVFAVGTGNDAADLTVDEVGVRTTQAFVQAATKLDSEMRVTQNFLQVASKLDADAQLSQSALLTLWGDVSDSVQYSQAALLALVAANPCYTQWTQIWTITRNDGTVLRFTTLDVDFVWKGNTYLTCGSLESTASESFADLAQAGNVELNAIINSSYFADQDLLGGLFDGATVEAWTVPWSNATDSSPFRIIYGEIGRITKGTVGFRAEILTPAIKIQQQNLLDVYAPSCRHKLGDSRCSVDIDALEVSGTVTSLATVSAPNISRKRAFFDSSRGEDNGYFNHGELTFTGGNNIGVTLQIETFTSQSFLLWDIAPYRIEIGDTYTAKPGCDKTSDTCKNKFSNFDNYGGFPHVPGLDGILGITTRRSETDSK